MLCTPFKCTLDRAYTNCLHSSEDFTRTRTGAFATIQGQVAPARPDRQVYESYLSIILFACVTYTIILYACTIMRRVITRRIHGQFVRRVHANGRGQTEIPNPAKATTTKLCLFSISVQYHCVVHVTYDPTINRNGCVAAKDVKSLEWELQVVFPKEKRGGRTMKKSRFFCFLKNDPFNV